jgi:hypothetical protein
VRKVMTNRVVGTEGFVNFEESRFRVAGWSLSTANMRRVMDIQEPEVENAQELEEACLRAIASGKKEQVAGYLKGGGSHVRGQGEWSVG